MLGMDCQFRIQQTNSERKETMNNKGRILLMVLLSLVVVASGLFAAPVTLNLLMEDVPDTVAIEELLPQFEAQTGIKVSFEKVVYTVMHEKLVPQLMAQQGKGSYDVLECDNYWVGEFTQSGWLRPLDDYLKKTPEIKMSDYIDSIEKMFNISDKKYFIPLWSYPMGLVYRTDVVNDPAFKKAYEQKTGKKFAFPPADFGTLVEMAKVAKAYSSGKIHGVAMQGAKIDPIVMELFNYLVSVGGDIYNRKQWVASMNSPAGIKALTYYKDLLQNAAQPGASGANFDDALNVFAQGNAAFSVTYNFLMPAMMDPKSSKVAGKVAFVALPNGGLLGGWSWAIPKSTAHPDEAWQFIKWVEQKKIQKARGMAGGMPAVKWVYQDQEFLKKWPFQKMAYQAIATDKPVPIVSQSTRMIEIVGEYASQAMTGDITIQEAVQKMDEELNGIIQDDPLVEMQKKAK